MPRAQLSPNKDSREIPLLRGLSSAWGTAAAAGPLPSESLPRSCTGFGAEHAGGGQGAGLRSSCCARQMQRVWPNRPTAGARLLLQVPLQRRGPGSGDGAAAPPERYVGRLPLAWASLSSARPEPAFVLLKPISTASSPLRTRARAPSPRPVCSEDPQRRAGWDLSLPCWPRVLGWAVRGPRGLPFSGCVFLAHPVQTSFLPSTCSARCGHRLTWTLS